MTSAGVPTPTWAAMPISVDASAMVAATERSISPDMISSAMARAISAFSVKLKVRSDNDHGSRKYGEAKLLITKMTTAIATSSASHEKSAEVRGLSSRSGTRRGAWVAAEVVLMPLPPS